MLRRWALNPEWFSSITKGSPLSIPPTDSLRLRKLHYADVGGFLVYWLVLRCRTYATPQIACSLYILGHSCQSLWMAKCFCGSMERVTRPPLLRYVPLLTHPQVHVRDRPPAGVANYVENSELSWAPLKVLRKGFEHVIPFLGNFGHP